MAKANKGMRPQDIVILLKKVTRRGRLQLNREIAKDLNISASEVSEALERCRTARLIDNNKKKVNVLALEEFLIHGLKYVFPVQPQSIVRGIPTAISASPIKERIVGSSEQYVWPSPEGTMRGCAIAPLYSTVPSAAANDPDLHHLLAITDTLRIGRAREIEIAKEELKSRLSDYDIS